MNRPDIHDYDKRETMARDAALGTIRAIIAQVDAFFDVPGKDLDPNEVQMAEDGQWAARCYHCGERQK